MAKGVSGMKVRYLAQPEGGVGHLGAIGEGESKAQGLFPTRDEPVIVSMKGGALVPAPLTVGDRIVTPKGQRGTISEEVEGGRGLRRYVLAFEDGSSDELPESELRAVPPKPDLVAMLKEGRVGDAA